MNDKTKRIILITACCLLCGVAAIGIAGRFGGNTVTPERYPAVSRTATIPM